MLEKGTHVAYSESAPARVHNELLAHLLVVALAADSRLVQAMASWTRMRRTSDTARMCDDRDAPGAAMRASSRSRATPIKMRMKPAMANLGYGEG